MGRGQEGIYCHRLLVRGVFVADRGRRVGVLGRRLGLDTKMVSS